MPKLPAQLIRRAKLVSRPVVLALVVWFVQGAAREGWRKLSERIDAGQWSFDRLDWAWLLAAAALYSLGQLPNGLFWRKILAGLGQHLPTTAVLRAFYIGHLGKYVPGKAMVVVMRTGMLVRHGANAGPAAVSVFYETLSMMAVGAVLSALLLALVFPEQRQWLWAALGVAAITGLPTVPPVFEQIIRRLRIGRGDEAAASHEVGRLGLATFLQGWALLSLGWAFLGLSVFAAVRAGGFSSAASFAEQWTLGTAAAALSVVIGFLSFIPGGFGVRDGVLLTVLTWRYDEAAAMVTAVLVRLIWLVAELLVSIILYRSAGSPAVEKSLSADSPDVYDAADAEA
ncbi:MAG: lysylphosphatidylglycerol synthase domain-containing protein [Pirellulales bacterium]